jgi:BirA family biotin operon repressor/biotin-[acetyl-CoA-carboxylase] ligase
MFNMVIHLKKVTSTMGYSRRILQYLSPPFIVISEKQTGGHGQYNRKWESPVGGLWFTEVITLHSFDALSLVISIPILRVLKRYLSSQMVGVKWPNDIYVNGKKIAGILINIVGSVAFVGIGINVENSIPFSINKIATSMSYFVNIDKCSIFKEILQEEEKIISQYLQKGFSLFVNEYNNNLIFLNRTITIVAQREITGKVQGVDGTGKLLVETSSGHTEKISSGTVISF